VFGLILVLAGQLAGQNATPSLTVLSRDARRPIPIVVVGGRDYVPLDDLATLFQLTVREEAGAITVTYRGRTMVLTPEQALASVAGRLVSLPAPVVRAGGRWVVPVEFTNRVLAPAYDTKLELRAASRLLIVGELRVPRLAMRYDPVGTGARLTIDATPQTANVVTQETGRLTVRFDADALDAAIPPVQAQGLAPIVSAIRLADTTTIAIDLGPRFSGFRASNENINSSARLVIEFVANAPITTDTAAPPPPATTTGNAPPPSGDLPVFGQQVPVIRTIVLDPGHGGSDTGVIGAGGTAEKDVTLAAARRLRAALEGRLGVRVILTRDDDRSLALDDRTATANNNKADLFLSLHVNGSFRPATRGASIYVARFTDADKSTAALAHSRVALFGGGSRDIELVPWSLAQIRHVDQSLALARMLQREFESRVPLSTRSIDQAPLRVLEAANMPAALIEMGYLTNGEQERQLASNDFQSAIVVSVADAVAKFRDYLSGIGVDR
jgi:N-acetylmuramoyl-L-alanine amidase